MSIKEDNRRFKEIVRGQVKKDLARHISHGEIIGKKEDEYVKTPLPRIDIPNFRFGDDNENGVGQGNGDQGQEVPGVEPGQKPGETSAPHPFETEMSVQDLAEILGEKLSLPQIKPKGNKNVDSIKKKYSSLAPVGPQGLKNFKASYKKALRRMISSGTYIPESPKVIPQRHDMKFRSSKDEKKPQTKAVIFYIMDVSGSMGVDQKSWVQTTCFWINIWLKKNYKNLEIKFIIHDADAKEVSENEFFTISSAGGTLISPSYELCKKMIKEDFPVDDWNIYVFQFSDGDNWSPEDSKKCIKILEQDLLPVVNTFNYGQVDKTSMGQYIHDIKKVKADNLFVTRMADKSEILNAIKLFLGSGK